MEVFTPEAVLELLSTLVPLLSRPPFSSSTLEKVAWKYLIHLYLPSGFSLKHCSLQLGSLCKGLVKVGGHLERTNPSALSRLQVVQWHAFWSMVFYWTAMLWGQSLQPTQNFCIYSEFLSFFVLYSRLLADFLSHLGKWVKLIEFEAENEFFCTWKVAKPQSTTSTP